MFFDAPRTAPRGTRWLSRRPSPAATVLYCLPQAGFGQDQYVNWPAVAHGIEFCPLRFPGDDEPSWWDKHPEFADRAADLVADLTHAESARTARDYGGDPDRPPRTRQRRPYALFAHGVSALIAYEAVAELERRGGPAPARLFVSACPAPHRANTEQTRLPDEHDVQRLALAACVETGGVPLPSQLETSVRAAIAEAEALLTYYPSERTRLETPLTALSWSQHPGAGLEAGEQSMADWSHCGNVDFAALTGDEYEYVVNPAPLIRTLTDRLVPRGP